MPPNLQVSYQLHDEEDQKKVHEGSPLLTGMVSPGADVSKGPFSRVADAAARIFLVCVCMIAPTVTVLYLVFLSKGYRSRTPSVAFIGNSMQYYNDLPRLMVTLTNREVTVSDSHGSATTVAIPQMTQGSCLHGGTTLHKVLIYGNGMFDKFNTTNALIDTDFPEYGDDPLYDFGSCTVEQLLFGYDPALEQQVYWKTPYLLDDGSNPCLQDGRYYDYLVQRQRQQRLPPSWSFVVLNDNTMSPGEPRSRADTMQVLVSHYLPWFRRLGARTGHQTVPVLFATHGYWTEDRNLTGLANFPDDIPHFTSVTYAGYQLYYQMIKAALPKTQTPRIAPVGLAWLLIWEENHDAWKTLFHADHLHASPSGTLLNACVVHHTLFGTLPSRDIIFPKPPRSQQHRGHSNEGPSQHTTTSNTVAHLWKDARVMQEIDYPPNPFPTIAQAEYLYNICHRITVLGERPKSWKDYHPDITASILSDEKKRKY